MKLDRVKILNDFSNQIMFNMSYDEEIGRIKEHILNLKDNVVIGYCHKCHSIVRKDIDYIKSIMDNNQLTYDQKFNELNVEKISAETRCKLVKNAILLNYQYNEMSDEELFNSYVDLIKHIQKEYNPEDTESVYMYDAVKHLNPDTITLDDLMIEDELETSDPKTYCGEDRSLDKEYVL